MNRKSFLGNMAKGIAASVLAPNVLFANEVSNNDDERFLVRQFKDIPLAHFSYAILSGRRIILVDPARNPETYYAFAQQHNAQIVGVIETHPHADFVSSHLEIHKATGATIYASSLTRPAYAFQAFDEGKEILLGDFLKLKSINTPGHAPDGISVLMQVDGTNHAIFSGDSLLIGDVGRPDLRESDDNVENQRAQLAALMYDTVWNKYFPLSDNITLYPAHGAGSLCGKSIRDADSSTIGYEKQHNPIFKLKEKKDFIDYLLKDLPAIPAYFAYDLSLNIKGASDFLPAIKKVSVIKSVDELDTNAIIIDTRQEELFKAFHIPGSINIQEAPKFETWLGTIVKPGQPYYLLAGNSVLANELTSRAAKIGYEANLKGYYVITAAEGVKAELLNIDDFKNNKDNYTIVDVRTSTEFKDAPVFTNALNIPLQQLIDRLEEIPKNKPITVICRSGYRSAIGSSIIKKYFPEVTVLDLGSEVTKFNKK